MTPTPPSPAPRPRRRAPRPPSFFVAAFAVLLTALLLLAAPRAARAQTAFFSAPGRVDMVHDARRDMVYITNGREVTRYKVSTGALWNPFYLALPAGAASGGLGGIDLSPDGDTLAVADRAYSGAEVWIWLIDLNTGVSRRVPFPIGWYEGGSWTVAFAGDGSVLLTTRFRGSGWTPLRRYDPATGATTDLGDVRQDTMLSASADGSTVAFAESNSSDGPWGRYRTADGSVARRDGYTNGTSWFNYEIGVSRDGSQFAVPTYGGCYIYDANFARTHVIGTYAGPQPVGVAYDPTGDRVYFAWSTTSQVRAYDSRTMTQAATYEFANVFDHNGNWAFTEGRLRISRDGTLLFATVAGGVRVVRVKGGAPTADPKGYEATEDTPVNVTLSGKKGDGTPATQFRVATAPASGTVTGTGASLVYTPAPDYSGQDSFTYVAVDGTAESAPATVRFVIRPVNDPPTAQDVAVSTDEDTPAAVTLRGADVDSPASGLSDAVTQPPAHGTLSGTGANLTYAPAADYHGPDSFAYVVRDASQAQSSTATVTITVKPVNDAPTAVNDSATTRKGVAVDVPVRANDGDPDGDPLTVVSVSGVSNGTATVTAAGTVRYTPTKAFVGTATFRYTVRDPGGATASATVTVTVTKK